MATEQLGSPRHLLQYVTGDALKIKNQEIDMETRAFWKVCKKLANEERIDVLRKVMTAFETDGLPVGQIADAVRIGQPATSTYLAQLQNECGLVACARTGRYCLYRAEPDPNDPKMTILFPALKNFFRAEATGHAFFNGTRPAPPRFLSVLPALSNAARVQLLGHIRSELRTNHAKLAKHSGISALNVRRHIACIESCGLVNYDGNDIVWTEPADALSRIFIDLSLS